MDDRALVARCADGDRDAWLALVDRYDRRILRVLRQTCGASADLEDLRQEVYSRLLARDRAALARFCGEREGSLPLLLAQVARSVAVDHLRARGSRPAGEELTSARQETLASDEPSPERRVGELRWSRALAAALDKVAATCERPGRDRDILRLHYEESYSVPEIAAMGLGLPRDGVESVLRRLRGKVLAAATAELRLAGLSGDDPPSEDP